MADVQSAAVQHQDQSLKVVHFQSVLYGRDPTDYFSGSDDPCKQIREWADYEQVRTI